MVTAKKNNERIEVDVGMRFGLIEDKDLTERAVYGTRAILDKATKGYKISFVPGRTSVKGYTKDLDKMEKFLNKASTKKEINKFASKVGTMSREKLELWSPDGFRLTATPNGSGGYIYVKMVWPDD